MVFANATKRVPEMKIAQIASTIGLSAIKHTLGGLPMAAGFGFSYLEVVLFTSIGGILGVTVFLFLSEWLQNFIARKFPSKKPKKIFNRRNRMIVKVKKNFGLPGIAFITPALLSIPIGTIVASTIYNNHKKVFLYQTASVLVWSFGGAALVQPIAQWLGA
jgi:hypothetical protein